MKADVLLKRAYVPWNRDDGYRVLVDRLWPRGVTRTALHLDLWLKEIAPSTELRRWFGHEAERWQEFQRRYRAELESQQAAVSVLHEQLREGRLTLVYGARDEAHNHALVLRDYLLDDEGT